MKQVKERKWFTKRTVTPFILALSLGTILKAHQVHKVSQLIHARINFLEKVTRRQNTTLNIL